MACESESARTDAAATAEAACDGADVDSLLAALRRGAAFMKERLENMPAGKRIYVHCKGGIARASTMSLAHYIINRGEDPYEAVDKLKAKRSVVLRSAAEYEGVRAIARDPEGNHCE